MNLNTTLTGAIQSLFASTGALQTTNNNIANANTPGYTREVVELQSSTPLEGGGVTLVGYQSIRDEVLQTQIQQQSQQQGGANAQLNSLTPVQTEFTTSTQDIGTQMSALFSAISQLETNPSSSSLRQSVLTAGQNLATAFNTTSNALTTQQSSLNTQVSQDVDQINSLTSQIAALNPQIATMQVQGQDPGTLQDQRDQLVLQLSQLTNISTTQTNNGITITTGNGTALVAGTQSYALGTKVGSDGMVHVTDNNNNDITSTIQSGDLGGTIYSRDQAIPSILNQLDTLANQVGAAFNSVQSQGFTQSGAAGGNFFNIPSSTSGTAATISMAITDSSNLAASTDGSSGGGGNLANFAAIQNNNLPSGDTPTNTYANLVYQVGTMVSTATAESKATTNSLSQLNDQLSSVSGVSVDEESANLIRYQQAYEAAARVITTINSLYQVTMAMGTNSAA